MTQANEVSAMVRILYVWALKENRKLKMFASSHKNEFKIYGEREYIDLGDVNRQEPGFVTLRPRRQHE